MELSDRPDYLHHRKRLRERFKTGGMDGFHDHEVLELLLTYVIPRRDVKPIAWEMMKRFKTLSRAIDAHPQEIADIKGVGEQAEMFFQMLRAVMRRYFLEILKTAEDVIKSPEDVFRYCRASLEGQRDEVFEVLFLSTRNKVLDAERLAVGTLDRAAVYPRKVIESALRKKAAGLIFIHNHPSGDPSPSKEDEALTKELSNAAKAVGLAVHDHVIVGKGNYYSFRANNLIK